MIRANELNLPEIEPNASDYDRAWYSALYDQFRDLYRRCVAIEGTLRTTPYRFGWITRGVTTQTGATYTVLSSDFYLIANRAGTVTYTLPDAAKNKGRELVLRTITANTVVSASSNVVPLAGGAAGTAILAATAGKWALCISDGANWQIMEGN